MRYPRSAALITLLAAVAILLVSCMGSGGDPGAHSGAHSSSLAPGTQGVNQGPVTVGTSPADQPVIDCAGQAARVIRDAFPEPELRASTDGVLRTTLRASWSAVTLNGGQYETMNFEGSVPGPTLSVCPGDTLEVSVQNDLGATPAAWLPSSMSGTTDGHPDHVGDQQLINLHTHGLHVSPVGNSDDVFLSLAPGQTQDYTIAIPADNPPGMYWYHPHRHGYSEGQVYAGMFGAIMVNGGLDTSPLTRDIPTRTMEISSTQLGDGQVVPVEQSVTAQSPYLINGVINPTVAIRPGELQRWRILNADDNAIVRMALPGQQLWVVSTDGNATASAQARDSVLIGPGERRDVIVRGGPPGTTTFTSQEFAQFQGGDLPASPLATVVSAGDPVDQQIPAELLAPPAEDLRQEPVDQSHRTVFTEQQVGDGYEFLFNGNVFDPDRVDETMRLGEVNEWTLVNDSDEWHSFHIHSYDFQVTEVTLPAVPDVSLGSEQDVTAGPLDLQDTVKLPPRSTVVFRVRPTDFAGKMVFHCHMLNHEDRGMMGVVEILP